MSFTRRQILRDGGLLSLIGSSRIWQLTATTAGVGAGIILPSSYVLAEVKAYRDLNIMTPFGKAGVLTAAQIRDGVPLQEKFFLVEASDHKHAINITAAEMAMIRSGSLAKFKSAEHFSHKHDITIDPSKPVPGGAVLYDESPTTPVPTTPVNPPPASNSTPLISNPAVNPPPANNSLPVAGPLVSTPNVSSTSTAPVAGLALDFNVKLGYGEKPFIYLMSNTPLAKGGAKFRGQGGAWNPMYQVDIDNKHVFSSHTQIDFGMAAEQILIEFSAQSIDGQTKMYSFYLRRR